MGRNIGFDRAKEERNNLSFFKIFQTADLSSESMRALPYQFMINISSKDFSNKMMVTTLWGRSWELQVSKNPNFYYIEKSGWNMFVKDNAFGENEFVTFTLMGNMCFNLNIYEHSCKEILMPRNPYGEIKKEQGESSFKDVKKEDKTSESMVGVEVKGSSNKESKASKKIKKVEKVVPEFTITLNKTNFRFLAIPNCFTEDHIKRESKMFKIRHSDDNRSWDVLLLEMGTKPIFPGGWAKAAKDYPLSVGDMCTFKLVKPSEFVLVVSKKASEEIN